VTTEHAMLMNAFPQLEGQQYPLLQCGKEKPYVILDKL
jgi:hypothetical protein